MKGVSGLPRLVFVCIFEMSSTGVSYSAAVCCHLPQQAREVSPCLSYLPMRLSSSHKITRDLQLVNRRRPGSILNDVRGGDTLSRMTTGSGDRLARSSDAGVLS
jgi:hypothetical protein